MKQKADVSSHKGKSDIKKKILVVEDDPHALQSLVDRLEFEGYKVATAEDGEIAILELREGNPDLVILDVMLPKKHGYTICWLLKSDINYKHIPVIMLTARSQEADINLGKEVGADAYITKPFDMQVLLAKIRDLIETQ